MAHYESTLSWWDRWPGMNPSMDEERPENSFLEIVGESLGLRRMLKLAIKVARKEAPVLILGEAGSGKELIARAIHRLSSRRNESFVKVNCATAMDGTLDSELFGHQRGSAGTSRKVGQVELANNGILFLDKIAHVPFDLQAKLLHLLEHREFERLGSAYSIPVNVRLIATTQYDLGERVAEQTFRDDLYDQLNAFPIRVPPLRERRDDIPFLVRYFVQVFARRMNKHIEGIPPEAMSFLSTCAWPGNLRQLETLIERAVAVTEGPELQVPLARLQSESGRETS